MQRSDRVGEEMKKMLASIIREDLRDPRIPVLTSVTDVKVTRDLSHATVYISVYGSEEDKKACFTALKKANSFIRREVTGRMSLRISPELHFERDDSIETGMKISGLIDEALKKDKERSGDE